MGTINGVTGGITGKVGNMVFYYRDGKYVSRQYIPKPLNPKSEAQTVQRLKFALAGRLSAIVPWDALVGMSGTNKTQRRGRFLANVLRNVSYSSSRVGIRNEDILFSEGSVGVELSHRATATAVTVGSNNRVLTMTSTYQPTSGGESLSNGYGERYVVLLLNVGTSMFDYAVTGLLNVPEVSGTSAVSANTTVNIRVGDVGAEYVALMYVCPFLNVVGAGEFGSSYIGVDDGSVVVDLESGEVVESVVYGRSLFATSVVFEVPSGGN